MGKYTLPGLSLPAEVMSVIWRIVGNIESPLNRETPPRLIERTIRRYAGDVSSTIQDRAIAEIGGWFDFHEDKGWLKENISETVAGVIALGVKDALSSQSGIKNHETAFCAMGSINPDLAVNVIAAGWSTEEQDVFVDYAFNTLEALCKKSAVIDPDRVQRLGIPGAKASLKEGNNGQKLRKLGELKGYDWWLHPSISNMIELLVKLNPEHFYTLVNGVDHPIVHLRAARCVADPIEQYAPHVPLQWLADGSTDNMIALAVVQILDSVNGLDADLRWRTEPEGEQGDVDAQASCLLSGLLDRFSKLEPIACARWVCELLDYGIFALHAQGHGEKPPRVEELEKLCRDQLNRLVQQSLSDGLLNELRIRLCLNPLTPRILPLAQVALEILEEHPARSTEISRLILETHEQQITDALNRNDGFYYHLELWTNRDWVSGLAYALVLSDREIRLPEWVSQKCRALPLSAWDAEEDYRCFLEVDKLVEFRFLVALHAVQLLPAVGRPEDPAAVRALAEAMWAHSRFVGRHISLKSEGSSVAEYAARVAIVMGEPIDEWILDQAGNPAVGPQTLWAMLDQEMPDGTRMTDLRDDRQALVVSEFRRLASDRFANVRGLDITELSYLGKLWLMLGATEEAEETAMAIVSFPERRLNRAHKVIALKLLAFAASKRRPAPETGKMTTSLYSEVWSPYSTSTEELDERRQIDNWLASAYQDITGPVSRDDVT